MRESELREWIEELAEEQGEKERQRGKRKERERQALEELRQSHLEQLRERCEEKDVDPDLALSLFEFSEEFVEEEEEKIEARREELIEQGEDVDLPNETSAFLDGAISQSEGFAARRPYYVEVRGREGELEYSDRHPESIDVRVNASRTGRRSDYKTVNWWFSFTPDETKLWDLVMLMPYRGFYLQQSVTPPRSTSILAMWEEYRVHQYNAGPREREFRLVELHSNINQATRYDRTLSGNYSHVLAEGDPALLHIHQAFEVALEGSGASRSELNFETGTSNKLPAPYFYAR